MYNPTLLSNTTCLFKQWESLQEEAHRSLGIGHKGTIFLSASTGQIAFTDKDSSTQYYHYWRPRIYIVHSKQHRDLNPCQLIQEFHSSLSSKYCLSPMLTNFSYQIGTWC